MAESASHHLEQSHITEPLDQREAFRTAPGERFDQRSAQVKMEGHPVLEVQLKKGEKAPGTVSTETKDISDALSVCIPVGNHILIRVMHERQRNLRDRF